MGGVTIFALGNVAQAQTISATIGDGVQPLARGPVHEAFAETVAYNPEPGYAVPQRPPAPIDEIPPDYRPAGENISWIPGYWTWDDDRNGFVWVSGIWRNLPPGRQWMPGYWTVSGNGYRWATGYWADANTTEVEYLPEPPESQENGPTVRTPSDDYVWIPGCWLWQDNRYVWRPGFWAEGRPDWVWVPAHYIWSPSGYVFVDGYWDYPLDRRGVLFAPVYFPSEVYERRDFTYSPATVVNLGSLVNHLFMRPRYQHYYFGDYYGANYRQAGFYPWFSIQRERYGYDPIYVHQHWHHRHDRDWNRRLETDYQNRRDREDLRPPHTWAESREWNRRGGEQGRRDAILVQSLDDFRKSKDIPLRFQQVDQSERRRYSQYAQDYQRFRDERQKWERSEADTLTERRDKGFSPGKVRLPNSPIASKPEKRRDGDQGPPKAYDAPQPDWNRTAQPRQARTIDRSQQRTVNRIPFDENQPKIDRDRPPQRQPGAMRGEQPDTPREARAPRQPSRERDNPKPPPQVNPQRNVPPNQPKIDRDRPPQRQPSATRGRQPDIPREARAPRPPSRERDNPKPPPQGNRERNAPPSQGQPKADRGGPQKQASGPPSRSPDRAKDRPQGKDKDRDR